jgi:hypothetical protein
MYKESSANKRDKITIYLPYLTMVELSLDEAMTIEFLAQLIKNEEERVNNVSTVNEGLRLRQD